jgi:hypothetical protein
MAEAKAQLHEWADQGLITDRQAKNLIDTFRGLIGRAKDLSDVDPTVTVKANLSDLDRIDQWLASHRGMTVPLTVQPSTGQVIPHGLAGGGPVVGPGTGTSDDVWKRLSNGEFVVTADGSNLGDALRFYGYTATSPRGGDGASAGSGSKVSITINDVPAEKVAGSIPQALREAAYVSGNAW